MTATEALFSYVLATFFFFYLANYAEITAKPVAWVKGKLGPRLGYPISCAFCWMSWQTLCLFILGVTPLYWLFAAPVLHLFLDALYDKLVTPPVIK